MYAKLHWNLHRGMLEKWSTENVRTPCREIRVVETGKYKGVLHDVCIKFMPSLRDLRTKAGFKMYPPYTERERRLYHPNTEWRLHAPCSDHIQLYSLTDEPMPDPEHIEDYVFPRFRKIGAVSDSSSDEEEFDGPPRHAPRERVVVSVPRRDRGPPNITRKHPRIITGYDEVSDNDDDF